MRALGIEQELRLENRLRVGGEEALMVLLFRLAFPVRFSTMVVFFQRSESALGRIFRAMLDFVFTNHRHRVQNYLDFWEPYFGEFSRAIDRKQNKLGLCAAQTPATHRNTVGFIDGTIRRCARPARVAELDIQRTLYNGWKKVHAIKFQAVEFPNGLCGDLFGPTCGSHNDNFLLRLSAISQRMLAYRNGADPYKIYGDAAYPNEEQSCAHTKEG